MYNDNYLQKKNINPLKIKAAIKDPNSAGMADSPDEKDKGGAGTTMTQMETRLQYLKVPPSQRRRVFQ